jgi:hypothetical protein
MHRHQASLEEVITPGLVVFYDFDNGSGMYAEASASHTFEMNPKVEFTPTLNLGYNHEYFRDNSSFSHVELKLPLSINPRDWFNVTVTFAYSKSLYEEDTEDVFYAVMSASATF